MLSKLSGVNWKKCLGSRATGQHGKWAELITPQSLPKLDHDNTFAELFQRCLGKLSL